MTTTENPWAVYDLMGIPHLERFLDEGADFVGLDLTEEEVEAYAVQAAMRWHDPPVVVRGENAAELLTHFFFELVAKCCAQDSDLTYHDDDRITVGSPLVPGERLEVTEERMRHWQWMLVLFGMQDVAERFLAAVPERIRAKAMSMATSDDTATHATFLEMVFPSEDGT